MQLTVRSQHSTLTLTVNLHSISTATPTPHIRRSRASLPPTEEYLVKWVILNVRAVIYARVSTEQDAQQNSYEAQIEYYTNYIQGKPDWEFVGIYADEGISGTSYKNRTGFNRMIEDAKAGKIQHILAKSIARFARNVVDCLSVIDELREVGVGVHFDENNLYNLIDP